MAPATTSVPRAIASVTGWVAPRFVFSVRPILSAPLRRCAPFAVLCLRDALALFEAVFVVREEGRPRALLPRPDVDPLAKDLGEVVFAGVLLGDTPVFDTVFLEAVGFSFLEAGVLFAAGRPRALVPRPDLEAVLFGDLAILRLLCVGISWTRPAVIATVGRRASQTRWTAYVVLASVTKGPLVSRREWVSSTAPRGAVAFSSSARPQRAHVGLMADRRGTMCLKGLAPPEAARPILSSSLAHQGYGRFSFA
jgi:hypothetical protein